MAPGEDLCQLRQRLFGAILLHALVDFSVLGLVGDAGQLVTIAAFVPLVMYLVTIAAGIAMFVSSGRARGLAA